MNKIAMLLLIGLSIVLAITTRFYLLGEAPHGLYLDEAGQGYSAYSILKTGKDEFGKPLPIVFRSFMDFKTPVYIYLIVPLINVFGLTKFTVRLPSFIFSILTIPFLYLLIKNLFIFRYINLNKLHFRSNQLVAALTVLFISITPWHILFGRTNFEVNVSVFFLISGLYFFYKSLGWLNEHKMTKPKYLIISAISFAIAIPAYHSQRIVTPLILIILFLRHRKFILSKDFRLAIIVSIVVALFISIPTILVSTTPGFLARAAGLNIFTNNILPAGYLVDQNNVFASLTNWRGYLTTKEFAGLYTSYFSPRNLFILGDSGPRSGYPYLSTFYLWQFPFMVIGLFELIRNNKLGEFRFLAIALLLISPLPAAVTRDPFSTIRSLNLVIPLSFVVGLGVIRLIEWLLNKSKHYLIDSGVLFSSFIVGFILVSYSLVKVWSSAIILNEYYRAIYWDYGWQEVAETIKSLNPKLPIIVDNARGEPYSQLAFFLEYDPNKFQNENYEVPLNEYYTNMNRNTEKHIGVITTRPINWEVDLKEEKYLVGDELAISIDQIERHKLELVKEILYPDTKVAFRIVKVPSYSNK